MGPERLQQATINLELPRCDRQLLGLSLDLIIFKSRDLARHQISYKVKCRVDEPYTCCVKFLCAHGDVRFDPAPADQRSAVRKFYRNTRRFRLRSTAAVVRT